MGKNTDKKDTDLIRVSVELKERLEKVSFEVSWMLAKTMDDKIGHLLWFYESYKNNNKK